MVRKKPSIGRSTRQASQRRRIRMQTRKQEECLLADKIKTEIFLIEDTESKKFLAESEDSIQNELFHDEEQMQESLLADDIKPEILLNENIGNKKFQAESGDGIKNELCFDEEQTWGSLELANDRDCIKTECEVYNDKENYDQIKKEIDDTVDSFEVEPSDKVYDHVIKEEFEIENATYSGDMAMNENSLQSCINDTEDSFQSGKGVQESVHNLESGDVGAVNFNDSNKSKRKGQFPRFNYPNTSKRKPKLRRGTKKVERSNVKQNKEVKCYSCEFFTKPESLLDYHINRVHRKLERYKCPRCDYRTMLKTRLTRHIVANHCDKKKQRHHIERFFKLNNNQNKRFKRNFSSKKKLNVRQHINNVLLKLEKPNASDNFEKIHVREKPFKCKFCDFSTDWKHCLRYHLKAKHNVEHPDEIITLEPMTKFECYLCEYSATRKWHLKLHIEGHHLKLRKYHCIYCDYEVLQRSRLKTHIDVVHIGKKEFQCEKCDFMTASKRSLQDHVLIKHSDDVTFKSIKKFKCDLCDYSGRKKWNLKYHVDHVHLKIREHQCTHCDYKSSTKYALNSHINIVHLGKKEFKCEDCHFSTGLKGSLRSHVLSKHSDKITSQQAKKFKCDLCDYTVMKKSTLKSHVNAVHLKIRKHQCNHCDYKSAEKGGLKIHIESKHHAISPLECKECDFSVSRKRNFKNHCEGGFSVAREQNIKNDCEGGFSVAQEQNIKNHCEGGFSVAQEQNIKNHCDDGHPNEKILEILNKFKCHLCPFCTKTESELKYHLDGVHLPGIFSERN